MSPSILHLVSRCDRYGPARQLVRLLSALPLRETSHQVVILGRPGPACDALAAAGVGHRALERRWRVDPIAWGRLRSLLRRTPASIVHAWDFAALAAYATAKPRSSRLAVVATVDNRFFPERGFTRPLLPPSLSRLDRIVATSGAARDEALRYQIPEEGLTQIPLAALPPEPEGASRQELLDELQLPSDAVLIGAAGPLVAERNWKELIWAADMVRVIEPRLRLLVIGTGPQQTSLMEFARTAAVPENICFAGDLPPERALPHLAVYWEGSERGDESGVLLDAMAAGVPVVASDTPLHREWIAHGETGYLVGGTARADRSRVTHDLLTQPELRAEMGQRARQEVERQHSLADCADNYQRLYQELLGDL